MAILHQLGEGTCHDVHGRMPEDTPFDSVRVTLRILENKGHTKHRKEGNCNVYSPTQTPHRARKQAVSKLMKTFFGDSPKNAILSMLDMSSTRLSEAELREIAERIDEARIDEKSREKPK